jgi:hypothetical protein
MVYLQGLIKCCCLSECLQIRLVYFLLFCDVLVSAGVAFGCVFGCTMLYYVIKCKLVSPDWLANQGWVVEALVEWLAYLWAYSLETNSPGSVSTSDICITCEFCLESVWFSKSSVLTVDDTVSGLSWCIINTSYQWCVINTSYQWCTSKVWSIAAVWASVSDKVGISSFVLWCYCVCGCCVRVCVWMYNVVLRYQV